MKLFAKLKKFLTITFILFSTVGYGLEVCDAAKLTRDDLVSLKKLLTERFDSKIKAFFKEISGSEIKTEDYYLATDLSINLDYAFGPPYLLKAKFDFFLKTPTNNILSTFYRVPIPEHPPAEYLNHGGEVNFSVQEKYIRDWEGLPLKKYCILKRDWFGDITIFNISKENYPLGSFELFNSEEEIMTWNMPLRLVD
jgi:hypothetical protein